MDRKRLFFRRLHMSSEFSGRHGTVFAVSQVRHRAQQNARGETNPCLLFRRTAMQTLLIKDLLINEELDSNAMAAIQGGRIKVPTNLPIEWQISFWNIDPAFV
jgi:hypothetical protein